MKILQTQAFHTLKYISRAGEGVPTAAQEAVENYKELETKTYKRGSFESFMRDTMDYSFDGYSVNQAYKAFRTLHCNIKSGSFYEEKLPQAIPSSLETRTGIKFVQFPESVLKAVIAAQGEIGELDLVITDEQLKKETEKLQNSGSDGRGGRECVFIEKRIAPKLTEKQYGDYSLEGIHPIPIGEGMYDVFFKLKDQSGDAVYMHIAGEGGGIKGFREIEIGSYRKVLQEITEKGEAYVREYQVEDPKRIEDHLKFVEEYNKRENK